MLLKANYPSQEGLRPEEYCSYFAIRLCIVESSKDSWYLYARMCIQSILFLCMALKQPLSQNSLCAVIGYRPPWVVSSVAQNANCTRNLLLPERLRIKTGLNVTTLPHHKIICLLLLLRSIHLRRR